MKNKAKIAIILAGSGVFDGSEIHEAVLTMLAIDEAGAEYQCFAPNTWQAKTVDHFTGETTALAGDDENRNVLAESARIARGNIKPLSEFDAKKYDAIIFPGGFGAVINLSNFASKNDDCEIHEEVRKAIEDSYENELVIGAMCIAPVILAKVLANKRVRVTIGFERDTANAIEKMGARHHSKEATEICVDEENRVVTTPCYMMAKSISEVRQGTKNLVDKIIELI